MNHFCPNCGTELKEGAKFCGNCGFNVGGNQNNESVNAQSLPSVNIPERSIAMCVILSILTCGIYGIYWFICITDEVNAVSNEGGTSGGMSFLFALITCGIYGIYWAYRMGQKLAIAGKLYNKPIGDNSVIYLILQVVSLGIINYCLIQNDLNRFSR